jgi:exodeoxyribonuclease VII small subunit
MSTDPKAAPPSCPEANFEQALAALEQVVHELEEGRVGLDEALQRYEAGIKLLRQCHELLGRAERKIELLSGVSPTGQAQTVPFDDSQVTLEEKATARSGRRSAS